MSEEKPPEPPSAPLRPYWKDSGSNGCLIAYLGFIILCLIYIGVTWVGAAGYQRDGIWWLASLIFKLILGLFLQSGLGPILLILGVVSGAVYFGRTLHNRQEIGDEPSIAPQALPTTQSEESSNQEEGKIQPGKEN